MKTGLFLPLILLYPEVHYRFRYFPFSSYFMKEPEILADLPYKTNSTALPVFLIIKDADIYPVLLYSVKFFFVFSDGSSFTKTHLINKHISTAMYKKSFEFYFEGKKGQVEVTAIIQTFINGEFKEYINDNFKGTDSFLETYLDDNEELFEGHVQGDLHYHSDFTSDQVEFGAPLDVTKRCAASLGLDFFCVTDHSYDLDDDEFDFLKYDPKHPKFHKMRQLCSDLSDDKVTVIAGEEVTIKNSDKRNVHLLAFDADFIEGKGDGAEKWLDRDSEHSVDEIAEKNNDTNLFIAAHPFNKIPLLEYLFVKRGRWSEEDIENSAISHIQILNGEFDKNFYKGLQEWINMLLQGRKIFICAGNDAHGNFNIFRQIKFPMLSLKSDDKQLFGRSRTVVRSFSKNKDDIISNLKKGMSYITNGPHLDICVKDGERCIYPGNSFVPSSEDTEIELYIKSSARSGHIKNILLYRGSIHSSEEKMIWEKEFVDDLYTFNIRIPHKFDNIDHYLRLEVYCTSILLNGKILENRAYTNPVWLVRPE